MSKSKKPTATDILRSAMHKAAREAYVAALRDGCIIRATTIPSKKRGHQTRKADLNPANW